jgi:hypothetical protein
MGSISIGTVHTQTALERPVTIEDVGEAYCCREACHVCGCPYADVANRRLSSVANPLWGAPRVHGELLMLGIEIAQSTVVKTWCRGPDDHIPELDDLPPQTCRRHCFDRPVRDALNRS